MKFIRTCDFKRNQTSSDEDEGNSNDDFLKAIVKNGIEKSRTDSQLTRYFVKPTTAEKASVHYKLLEFYTRQNHNGTELLNFTFFVRLY